MMTRLFALPDTCKKHLVLVHNLVSNHHQAKVVAKYIQDYMVHLPPMAESSMNVNALNTKASSL